MRAAILPFFALAMAGPAAAAMRIESPDLKPDAPMPAMHVYARCGGQNVSPALVWSGQPQAARSLALTVIDGDARPSGWTHWIVTGLPPATRGIGRGAALPAGAQAMANNFGDAAYDGPCPPRGSGVHHYKITIWALPAAGLALPTSVGAREMEAILEKAAIDHASLTVTAQR